MCKASASYENFPCIKKNIKMKKIVTTFAVAHENCKVDLKFSIKLDSSQHDKKIVFLFIYECFLVNLVNQYNTDFTHNDVSLNFRNLVPSTPHSPTFLSLLCYPPFETFLGTRMLSVVLLCSVDFFRGL